jgi:O-antigen/teichoic acid export membrane protein
MRTLNSAKNLASSLGITLIMTLLGFFTRKVFVDNVGVEYLGLNGLLQNILGIMTLLEGGFATSVVYNLYRPLAEDNRPQILALLQLYRKVYRYIALGIILFALCLYPFIDIFIKDGENLEYVSIVYFIFLFNSVVGYFTAYKWSLVNASQQNYKLTAINLVYQVGFLNDVIGILLVLGCWGNYLLLFLAVLIEETSIARSDLHFDSRKLYCSSPI